jgi:hypothetical protein
MPWLDFNQKNVFCITEICQRSGSVQEMHIHLFSPGKFGYFVGVSVAWLNGLFPVLRIHRYVRAGLRPDLFRFAWKRKAWCWHV